MNGWTGGQTDDMEFHANSVKESNRDETHTLHRLLPSFLLEWRGVAMPAHLAGTWDGGALRPEVRGRPRRPGPRGAPVRV